MRICGHEKLVIFFKNEMLFFSSCSSLICAANPSLKEVLTQINNIKKIQKLPISGIFQSIL